MVEEGKPGFFAIASAPGADTASVELLIKSQPGSTAEAITSLAAGEELLVSSAQGKGEGSVLCLLCTFSPELIL